MARNTINVADGSGGDFVDCGGNPIGGDGVRDTVTKDAGDSVGNSCTGDTHDVVTTVPAP